ncbi:hypothetical protein [Streptomyces sp. NPDC006610]|uniref:hypothetical protein n=1 Tax=Streptomyces sp. NPDC006610 TaxID=3154584 RepID=UPI0033BDE57A
MTRTAALRSPAGPGPVPSPPHPSVSRPRRILRAVAIASCLPYLALKAAWVAGSRIGIPDGSELLEHRVPMAVANGVTILMDSAVVLLALLLTRPWGRAVPAWRLAVPVWTATGLLAPIMAGFPAFVVADLLGGSGSGEAAGDEPFLDGWVFSVVYTGFIVQGVALGALFVLYARDRWGRLWRGPVGDPPGRRAGTAQRPAAVVAALLALLPLTVRLLWAGGGTAGLPVGRITGRGSDFHVLEVLAVLFLAGAVTGALLLAFRRPPTLPAAVPLALVWAGSATLVCWTGWTWLTPLVGSGDMAERPSPLMHLTYGGQVTTGLLAAAVCVGFLRERSGQGERSAERGREHTG